MVDRSFEDIFSEFCDNYKKDVKCLVNDINPVHLVKIAQILINARLSGHNIYFIGNGGSSANAAHFAEDLAYCSGGTESHPFRAQALDNVSGLTAIANDYSFEEIFVRQLKVLLRCGDVVVALSASGNSPNLVNAVQYANEKGATTVGLLGFDGGILALKCHASIVIATQKGAYGPVEAVHVVVIHMICNFLAKYLSKQS